MGEPIPRAGWLVAAAALRTTGCAQASAARVGRGAASEMASRWTAGADSMRQHSASLVTEGSPLAGWQQSMPHAPAAKQAGAIAKAVAKMTRNDRTRGARP